MKRCLFFTGLSFLFIVSNAQVKKDKDPCDAVDVSKRFEVEAYINTKAWRDHLEKMTSLPDSIEAKIPLGTYNASVRFLIDTNDNIGEIQILNDPGYGLAKILINAISSYTGEWAPAQRCGRNVKAYWIQPMTFVKSQ